MQLVLLGSTGYHPNERRHTACLMLPELGLLLDAGTGMFRVRERIATRTLDIFLTHAHLDHVVGLTFLFDILYEKPVERVRVFGEADKLQAVQEHLCSALLFPVPLPCEYHPLTGPVELPDGGQLRYFSVAHPGGAIGFRLDWPGHSMAYVTDTTAAVEATYVEQLRGVDLLIHECYFPDSLHALAAKTGHSTTSAVAEVARAAAVKRLVLVHVNPLTNDEDPVDLATAQAIFPNTVLGYDLLTFDF